jgi:polyhydroxyalkanoate synthesis regulator phasin
VAAQSGERPESGVADALRDAVKRTFSAAGGSARAGTSQLTRERAAELVDELARLGRQASVELARRGQDAGADLARRGQEATGEVAQRLEALERRLATLEEALGGRQRKAGGSKRKAEG